MNEKSLPAPLDAALEHLDPNRRRFLGMLLAGAAALPLLTSSDLAVAQTTSPYKELGPAHKGSNTQLKSSNQQLKNAGKVDKMSPAYRSSSQLKNSNQFKSSNQQHKSSNTQFKSSNTAIKSSNTQHKGSNNQPIRKSGSANQGRVY
ncbi:MAG: hypothetical protein ABR865_07640 [Terracidiphilus sp.]|jgi:hypothetical protein